jgi:RimJ/RimL family protein N-acetyltransferase
MRDTTMRDTTMRDTTMRDTTMTDPTMTTHTASDELRLDPATVVPGGWSRRTKLRDGTSVLLRQIRPEDARQLAAGLRELSPESRYLRFHQDLVELTAEQLTYLTDVDHVDHEAIVAIDLDRPGHPGIGVARFIRDPYERQVAEAAVTVADGYRGQGAATLLLGALSGRGRSEGIEVFRNYVLARNTAMLDVFEHLGATRELEADGLWRVDLPLPERASDLPDSAAGRAFLAAAKDRFRLLSLVRPVWRLLPFGVSSHDPLLARGDDEGDNADLELASWLADRDHRSNEWPSGATDDPPGSAPGASGAASWPVGRRR